MKNFLNPKFLMIVLLLSGILFFAITSSQQLGTEIGKKNLENNIKTVKDMKLQVKEAELNGLQIDMGYAKKTCGNIINTTKNDLPEFEKEDLKLEIFKSYRLMYECNNITKQYLQATDNLKQIIIMEPQVGRWHAEMGKLLMKTNELGMAYRSVHLATQINPDNHTWFELEGDILTQLGQYDKALDSYKKALQNAPYDKAKGIEKKIAAFNISESEDSSEKTEEVPFVEDGE